MTRAPSWPPPEHSRQISIERDRIRWHVVVVGRGPALLALHGTGGSAHSFARMLPALTERFTVIAPDLPGHDRSRLYGPFRPSLPNIADALGRLLRVLELRVEIAIGHSAGAAIVARMALDGSLQPRRLVGIASAMVPLRGAARAVFPASAKLLARSSAARVIARRYGRRAAVERILRGTGSQLDSAAIEPYRRLSSRPDHVEGVLSMMACWDLDPLFADLRRLRPPVRLVAGADDRAVPLSHQQELLARIPDARLHVVPNAGHLVHEERPEAVVSEIFDGCPVHSP